ncbi:hypothetical protein ES703_101322 [subsurface metagenome]
MTGREGSGSTLAVNTKRLLLPVDFMLFYLGDVMGDVIDKLQAGIRFTCTQYPAESLSNPVSNTLAVSPGIVGGTPHGGKIGLTFGRLYRAAGKLAVGQLDAVPGHCPDHFLNVISGDLVPQATGPAVDIEHYLPHLVDTHILGDVWLIYLID